MHHLITVSLHPCPIIQKAQKGKRINKYIFELFRFVRVRRPNVKKVLYIDMDNVLVDFSSGINRLDEETKRKYQGRLDEVPGIFSLMDPIERSVDSFIKLAQVFDTYILSTSPWENPSAWSDKLVWVKKYLGEYSYKRLILSHHKNLSIGDYLIDDRTENGVDEFMGEHIHFGSQKFPDWISVMSYLLPKYSDHH